MQKFIKIQSVIAHLELDNVDTDMIIPKQFLKTIKRTGLGRNLFNEMRYDLDGNPINDFVLNKNEFQNSQIILSGENFGCGSSREHAPWALLDFGIRAIIAPSFADIFYNNCFKNSILPIKLLKNDIKKIIEIISKHQEEEVLIDLPKEEIIIDSQNFSVKFDIDPFRKKCLIEGLDDISLTLTNEEKISEFENRQKATTPWLYNVSNT